MKPNAALVSALLIGCILGTVSNADVQPAARHSASPQSTINLDSRMIPVLDCGQWGGNCSDCSRCKASHQSWNLEWWYYAFVPVAEAVDDGDLQRSVNESVGYIRGIAVYSAQNITNKHTIFGYKPERPWPGINTSQPAQLYSGIQIHVCAPIRGCYSILYHLGANYTANDTHWRHWSDDIYITNHTFKLKIDCGSFYSYSYATGLYDGPCADIELHLDSPVDTQPAQRLTNRITDATLALGLSHVAWFPYSLNARTQGKLRVWNYKMPSDGYYGKGETITLVDYKNAEFRTYWGHTFGARSGYDSGIPNWMWLYAQNMTCQSHEGCDFGASLNIDVGGQFGALDFIYIDGAPLRTDTFVAIDAPALSDAKRVALPDGRPAIQITQRMGSMRHVGHFQLTCAAERFTPYSANKFTLHATFCAASVTLRTRLEKKSSMYSTQLGLVELEASWLAGVGLLAATTAGPYPQVPYGSRRKT